MITRDQADNHESKIMSEHFLDDNDEYPLANYDGAPEFDITDPEKFAV
jgi:hypothetical protein